MSLLISSLLKHMSEITLCALTTI